MLNLHDQICPALAYLGSGTEYKLGISLVSRIIILKIGNQLDSQDRTPVSSPESNLFRIYINTMTQSMNSLTNYTFPPMQSKTDNGSNNLFEDNFLNTVDVWTNQYIETFTCTDLTSQGYYSPLPYHLQNDWMNNAVSASSPSLASTPENSPIMTSMSSPHPSHVSPNNVFPQNWPTGPTASEQTESIKEIQRLSQAKSVCLPSLHTLNIELQLTNSSAAVNKTANPNELSANEKTSTSSTSNKHSQTYNTDTRSSFNASLA